MKAIPYEPCLKATWNQTVDASRNGTFLFNRAYMDYHQTRFEDVSLLFADDNGRTVGLLPANIDFKTHSVHSHGGLTYGGLLLLPEVTLVQAADMLRLTAEHYLKKAGVETLVTKPVPYIYHRYPAQEELYWLYRAEAKLSARTVAQTIELANPEHAKLWKRKIKKQATEGLSLHEGEANRLRDYWSIVEDVLQTRHATRPVHSLGEIELLAHRFPNHIRLFTVSNESDCTIAGCIVFVTDTTAHMQYMEANAESRQRTALDWLIAKLAKQFAEEGLQYLDFGISTEKGGRILNEGLTFQKEGFGGRSVCYDTYTVSLSKLVTI